MALTEIQYGSLASSEVMNNNFNYLDGRINTVSESIQTATEDINSDIVSINNSIGTLEDDIEENATAISSIQTTVQTLGSSGGYVTTYRNGTSWYREYFSNANKTTRVWLEQGGQTGSDVGSVTLVKAFKNTSYFITACSVVRRIGGWDFQAVDRQTNKFTATHGYSNVGSTYTNWPSGTVWYACGV